MSNRVELRDFEAVELFRAALVRFIDTANGSLVSAEAEISHIRNWLESEQIPHWKLLLRQTAEDLERAKTAYRDKKNYKDASGARSSAIDELKVLRKVEAKRAEVERRAKATRRNLQQLQREATMYHGSAHHLRGVVNGRLANAAQELRGVVEQLEKYVQVAPEELPPELASVGMAREWTPEDASATGDSNANASGGADAGVSDDKEAPADVELAERLLARLPSPEVRRRAPRAHFVPPVPQVPPEAAEAAGKQLSVAAGRYDLVTTTLCPEECGDVYLHRTAPAGPGDSGWHIGSADGEAAEGVCVTLTVGRLLAGRPALEPLLALPQGSLMLAKGDKLVLVLGAGRQVLWQAQRAGED